LKRAAQNQRAARFKAMRIPTLSNAEPG